MKCTAIPCYHERTYPFPMEKAEATHTVTIFHKPDEVMPEGMTVATEYCLEDALYFAAWLPYCYPDEMELVSITPPASELFNREVTTK